MAMEFHWEEEKLGKAYDAGLMKRLLAFVRPYRWLFTGAIALSFVVTASDLAIPYIILKVGVDRYLRPALLGQEAMQGLTTLALILIGVLILRFLGSVLQRYLLEYSGQKVMYDIRTDIFAHLMKLPIRFFDRNPVGRLVTRATNDVAAINEMYNAVLVDAFRDIFLLGGIFLVMYVTNWQLALVVTAFFPVLVWITVEFRKRARDAYREVRRKLAKLNAYISESISGMLVTQLFVREEDSYGKFSAINREEYDAHMRQITVFAFFQPLIHMTGYVALAVILWYGGFISLEGAITVGTLALFIDYTERLFRPIRDLAQRYNILQGAMASSERIFKLLDEPRERYDGRIRLPSGQGAIEFRDVWFSYGAHPEHDADWVLKGVSFTVDPGESVAIVGPTGSGKTTIINLLLRLYEIQEGRILLDGRDIREIGLETLRRQMAVVLQDVFLFSGDVLGNIRLQEEHIPDDKAVQAARFVQADTLVRQLPQGYQTEVKERGATLSVGERQLLAFARAVAFDPNILVLDEATANIDSKTESLIQQAIDRVLEGRTSIAIAHRLSTIQKSDKILVLHQGRLIEQGSHEELLARRGLYHALHSLQFGETGPRSLKQFREATQQVGED